jgi:hypothetical protein
VYQPHAQEEIGYWRNRMKLGITSLITARAQGKAAAVYIPNISKYTQGSTSVYAELHKGANVNTILL